MGLNMGLPKRIWIEDILLSRNTLVSSKEKVLAPVVSKEGHAGSVLGQKRTYYLVYLKKCNSKPSFLLQTPL